MTAMRHRGNHSVPEAALGGSDSIWQQGQEEQAYRRAFRDSHPEHHGIIEQLDNEWSRTSTTTATRETLERWGVNDPVLACCAEADDVITFVQASEPERRDAMFVALLTQATDTTEEDRAEAELAVLMTLKLMLPRVVRIARGLTHVPEASDREAIAVASMYEAIRTYEVGKNLHRVPICLARSATHLAQERHSRIGRDMQASASEVLDNFTELDWIDEREPSADEELIRLLRWAVEQEILRPDEAAELLNANGRGASEERARRRGVSAHAVHKSRWRALQKITRAVYDFDPQIDGRISRVG